MRTDSFQYLASSIDHRGRARRGGGGGRDNFREGPAAKSLQSSAGRVYNLPNLGFPGGRGRLDTTKGGRRMSSAMMMERTAMGMPAMGVPGMGTPPMGAPTATPTGTSWVMVPRGTLKFEKCTGGMKVTCVCDDKMACSMVQNLCSMLAGGMCSCCVMMNGMTVCCCNLTMGICKCEMTPDGCTLTCT